MTTSPLITVEDVAKVFGRTDRVNRKTLLHELLSILCGQEPRIAHLNGDSFFALKGISFAVRRGEALGIIGHNGAGKTTLLRLLSGEYLPDKGIVSVEGLKSSLVDLTSGFSLDMTGRENVYFRGAHLGYSREFLKDREDAILEFAGLGDFIDSEIKSYSSGMLLRLGFAVSVLIEPDVLLIDEVLAVGDFLFADKCMRKLNELKKGAAIVYVSHCIEHIVMFTDKTLVLDRGLPAFIGDPKTAADYYYQLEEEKAALGTSRLSREIPAHELLQMSGGAAIQSLDSSAAEGNFDNEEHVQLSFGPTTPDDTEGSPVPVRSSPLSISEMGTFVHKEASIADVEAVWCKDDAFGVHSFDSGDPIQLLIKFRAIRPISRLVIGVPIWTADGFFVSAFGTASRQIIESIPAGCVHEILLDIPALPLNKGQYLGVLAIQDGPEYLFRQPIEPLTILRNGPGLRWGILTVPYFWSQGNHHA